MTIADFVINVVVTGVIVFFLAPWYAKWKTERKAKKRKPRAAKAKTEEGAGVENPHARAIDQHANARDKNWQP